MPLRQTIEGKTDNFYVIKYNTMPAILTELGFIDAKGEGEKLSSEQWRQRARKRFIKVF